MAITALHSAATGMQAMDTQLDVIANNLANTGTNGFKGSRVNFEDLFYEERRQPGALNSLGQLASTGLYVGHGVRVSNTQLNMKEGSLEGTESPLDLAIVGDGFFRVTTFEDIGEGVAYTRSGRFLVNRDGELVLGTASGPRLDPPITIDPNYDTNSVTVQDDGTITISIEGEEQEVGRLELYKFPNPHGLRLEGGNLFTQTEASGDPIAGAPHEAGMGGVIQRYLETSNVDAVKELVAMIRTQRNFELNSQTIRAVDESMKVISSLRR